MPDYVVVIKGIFPVTHRTQSMMERSLRHRLAGAGITDIEITLTPAGLQGLIDAGLNNRIIRALGNVGITDLTGLSGYPDDSLRPQSNGTASSPGIGWASYRQCVRAVHEARLSSPERPRYARTIESLPLDSETYQVLARTGARLITDLTSRTFVAWRRETPIAWPYAVRVWEALAKRKLHFTPADDTVTVADLAVLPLNRPTLLISHLAEIGVGPETPLSRITTYELVKLRAAGRITDGDLERALELCGLPVPDRYPKVPETPS
jgi:hypothetical protein